MSYDLFIQARDQDPKKKDDVLYVINTLLGVNSREIKEGNKTIAIVYLKESPNQPNFVQSIQVTSSLSEEIHPVIFKFCAQAGSALNWRTFDPQGNNWYSAADLKRGVDGNSALDLNGILRLTQVISGALLVIVGPIWFIQGRKMNGWFITTLFALGFFFGARLVNYLRGRASERYGS